jgi:carboxylate-amine ligase
VSHARRAPVRLAPVPPPATLGVQEELWLLDEATLLPASRSLEVLSRVQGLRGELTLTQVETVSPVCDSLEQVAQEVARARGLAIGAARAEGLAVASCGTSPLGSWRTALVSDSAEYDEIRGRHRRLVNEQMIAGLHVHVGVASREDGVAVLDRIRPWLPVLLALTASSPFCEGADTGFASWRSVQWRRWPVSGPPPAFDTVTDYDEAVRALATLGLATGERQVYWDARLSARFPTVEVRVCDAQPSVADTVAVAALVRGLAAAALAEEGAGQPRPKVSHLVVDGATWHAARWGLTADLVDPRSRHGDLLSAREVVDLLLQRTDCPSEVEHRIRATVAAGGPAQRMRTAGSPEQAARWVVGETASDVPVAATVRRGGSDEPDSDERRLLADVPPHHG